jgi:hypothetical protein
MWIDHKYIALLAPRLRNFKQKSPKLYNCACPICGDSKRNRRKSRGYFYEKQSHWYYHCHNCGITLSVEVMLKRLDPILHSQYLMEKISDAKSSKDAVWNLEKPVFHVDVATIELHRLATLVSLPNEHLAKQYAVKRQLPYEKLRWCPNFMVWTNSLLPGKFEDKILRYDEGRIIIPYFDQKGAFFAYQGRAISGTQQRYISIILNHDPPRLFGMDTVDVTKDIFVFEGPFDSLFIPNSVAGQISDLTKLAPSDRFIICFDKEPRSSTTVKKIQNAIDQGFRVCIWPRAFHEKDVNEMILEGKSPLWIQRHIEERTYSGLMALNELAQWSKV